MESGETQFIDIDKEKELAGLDHSTYEEIVLRQIREAAIILSKPRSGGQVITKVINGKSKTIEIPDVKETIIHTVNTLKDLLKPFIKDKYKKEFEQLDKYKKQMEKDLDEKEITVGNITKKAKEFDFLPPNHNILKIKRERECSIAEKLFAILVQAFHSSRMDIKALEYE